MKFVKPLLEYALYSVFTFLVIFAVLLGSTDLVPNSWNPLRPLDLREERTIFTAAKFQRALLSKNSCMAALETGAVKFSPMDDLVSADNSQCHIKDRVRLSGIGAVAMAPVETRCDIALRLSAWVIYDLEPMALDLRGSELTALDHFGSYNCRRVRTSSGNSSRMSKHATAEALDISGFRFANGQSISLSRNWNGDGSDFLHKARDTACDRFPLVLSPDYNALHADHFHLEEGGWRRCR